MLPPVPNVESYDISNTNGFLPREPPLDRLPDPYYAHWETMAANIQALVLSRRLREVVQKMPVLSTARLKTEPEWRRAYQILAFATHGYVWGGDQPAERVPQSVSIPFLQVCEHLELPPVATFAGLCLWNWRPIFANEPIDSPDNLATLMTLTGSTDESWFYLVSVAIEARGGPLIALMLEAMKAARENDFEAVTIALQIFAERLDEIGHVLTQMHERCDPHIFYHRIRPMLAGFRNMADAGLPRGVLFEDGSGTEEWQQYGGGSNAQSSLIQFFDIVLGIAHRPTGVGPPSAEPALDPHATAPPPQHNFILEMQSYMPGPHRRFLSDVTAAANIREFVHAHLDNRALTLAYDACLAMLRALRDKHIQLVSRYIVVKTREARAAALAATAATAAAATAASSSSPGWSGPPSAGASAGPINLASAGRALHAGEVNAEDVAHELDTARKHKMRGTGGTALILFLKQARDETGEPAIESWARRLLLGGSGRPVAAIAYPQRATAPAVAILEPLVTAPKGVELGKVGEHADGDRYIMGLAGTWAMDDDEGGGGICHW